jgi:CheY-like chemotaxis protein
MADHRCGSEAEKDAARRPVVLVVEDEILMRSAVAEELREAGFTVLEAADALEAMAVLASGDPVDAVFTDIQMPGPMDGLGLAQWIGRHRPGLCVLLTSGAALHATRPADASFLPKPYTGPLVVTQLRSLLGRTRS